MKKAAFVILFFMLVILGIIVSKTNDISIYQLDDTGAVRITINFFMDMKNQDLEGKVHLISERPGTDIKFNTRWLNSTTLEILAVEEGFPKGFKTKVSVGPLKTPIPGLYKRAVAFYQPYIPAFLTKLSPIVPSSGPIIMNFSTPVSMKCLEKNLKTDFEFKLKPKSILTPQGDIFTDYSEWHVFPKDRLKAETQYIIEFDGTLKNLTGREYRTAFSKVFSVAPAPKVLSTDPEDKAENIELYYPIKIDFDQELKDLHIRVSDMAGDTKLEGKSAVYKPHAVYLPGKTYKVEVQGKSIFNEKMKPYNFQFSTVNMEEKMWVEVDLKSPQKVVVYRGAKAIRTMPASGGLPGPDNETPLGFFYIKDRGYSFFSERFGEGALYWVRIKDNYLFHSVPRDREGKIIREELEKIGFPASHGCIRLKDDDAKWFYENVPAGTLVIIHD